VDTTDKHNLVLKGLSNDNNPTSENIMAYMSRLMKNRRYDKYSENILYIKGTLMWVCDYVYVQ
jgi:hypothetical protein